MSTADAAALFAALGDRTRLSLVMRLGDGRTASLTALAAGTGVSRQAVTKHLRLLADVGMVTQARSGRETRYALHPDALATARGYLDEVAAQWDAALGRLKTLVEDQSSG